MPIEKEYLGDGVYAEDAGFGIILTTENGSLEPTNTIALEPEVAVSLSRFMKRWSVENGINLQQK